MGSIVLRLRRSRPTFTQKYLLRLASKGPPGLMLLRDILPHHFEILSKGGYCKLAYVDVRDIGGR